MGTRVLILGAGFGGLELATTLSEELGDEVEVTLIDKGDAFVFGYSKLDVLFGRTDAEAVRLPYAEFAKPGVRLLQETVRRDRPRGAAGDHRRRRRTRPTSSSSRSAPTTTSTRRPGLAEARQRVLLGGRRRTAGRAAAELHQGRAIVGVCGAPFKCPPAPSEAALLLHDHLTERGVRDAARSPS